MASLYKLSALLRSIDCFHRLFCLYKPAAIRLNSRRSLVDNRLANPALS